MAIKKIIYFTAGQTPTVTELAEIAVLNGLALGGIHTVVRDGANLGNCSLETADYAAGTIPSAYSEYVDYGSIHANRPLAVKAFPATVSIAASATKQISFIGVTGSTVGALTVSDITATNATYASSDATKATVSAGGLITGVAAGTCTITATYTYSSGKTATSTIAVTVTA